VSFNGLAHQRLRNHPHTKTRKETLLSLRIGSFIEDTMSPPSHKLNYNPHLENLIVNIAWSSRPTYSSMGTSSSTFIGDDAAYTSDSGTSEESRRRAKRAYVPSRGLELVSQPPKTKNAILQLPYEIILAIFKFLPNKSTINALAAAHHHFEIVQEQCKATISRALVYTQAAEITKEICGHGDVNLAILSMAISGIKNYDASYESVARDYIGRGGKSGNVSDDDISDKERSEMLLEAVNGCWVSAAWGDAHRQHKQILRDCHRAAGHLEFLGCFLYNNSNPLLLQTTPTTVTMFSYRGDPNMNLKNWFDKRFNGITARSYEGDRYPQHTLIVGRAPKKEYIEALLIIELWCHCWLRLRTNSPSREEFLSLFSKRSAARVEAFAKCYMRGV